MYQGSFWSLKVLLLTALLGASGEGRHLGKLIVQLKEVGRGGLERRKEFERQSVETQGTCSSLLPSFPSWIVDRPASG